MQANPKRNPNYELLYNCTGHQSVMIMQSVPYCLKAAAFAVQEYEINQVIKYIEKNLCDDDEYVTDVEVDIHWADDVSAYDSDNNENDNKSNKVNDLNNENSNNQVINVDNDDGNVDINVNTGDQQSNDFSSVDIDVEILPNNYTSAQSSASQHDSDWLDSDILQDSVSARMTNSDSELDQKQEILPQVDDNINIANIDANVECDVNVESDVNNDINQVNAANLNQYASNVKPLQYKEINFHYRYTVSGCDKVFLLDNNDNKCQIKYSRTFNLGSMFDYCSLLRKVFCVFATLKWPKNVHKTTEFAKSSYFYNHRTIF